MRTKPYSSPNSTGLGLPGNYRWANSVYPPTDYVNPLTLFLLRSPAEASGPVATLRRFFSSSPLFVSGRFAAAFIRAVLWELRT